MTLLKTLARALGFRMYRHLLLITDFQHHAYAEIPTFESNVVSFTRQYELYAGWASRRAIKWFYRFRKLPFVVEIRPDASRVLEFSHESFFASSWEPDEYPLMAPRLTLNDVNINTLIADLELKGPVRIHLDMKVYSNCKMEDWTLRFYFRNSLDAVRFKFEIA